MQAIPRRRSTGPAPATFTQELLFLLDRSGAVSSAYNVPRALRLLGPLDIGALRAAIDGVVARHEVLRTTLEERDQTVTQRINPAAPVALELIDLSTTPETARAARLAALLAERASATLDLERDLLLRPTLVTIGAEEHVLFLLSHHIASDGWSKGVLFTELAELYRAARRGESPALPALPIQLGDFAEWQRSPERQAEVAEHATYWRRQLDGAPATLGLATDRPRPPRPGPGGAHCTAMVPGDLVRGLKRLAADNGATLYMVLLAAYHTLLHRHGGMDDVITGSPVAGRGRPELDGLIGYFANVLPLRSRFHAGLTFAGLVQQVCETCLDAFEHEDLPLEQLLLELRRGDAAAEAGLFQAVLTMEDTIPSTLALDGLRVEPMDIDFHTTKFDLTLMVAEWPEGLRLALWYRTEMFDAATVDAMLARYGAILGAAVAHPDCPVDALPLSAGAGTAPASPEPCAPVGADSDAAVLSAIAAVVAARPDDVAVWSGVSTLSYGRLDGRARVIAAALAGAGVAPGDRVGLLVDRSVDAIAGVLGVWYAGAAYVPLTPDLPSGRLAAVASLGGIRVWVCQRQWNDGRLPAGAVTVDVDQPAGAAPHPAHHAVASDPAYVLFTSGSTGEPKGVVVTHGNLGAYTRSIIERLDAGAVRWVWASVSTLAADLGHTAVFPALMTGGILHVVPEASATDPEAWREYVVAHRPDVLKITPSHLAALLGPEPSGDSDRLPARWLVLGGEPCPWPLVERVKTASRRVLNHYGPTEATVGACTLEVTDAALRNIRPRSATVPIGLPLPHATAEVLDAGGAPVPWGVVGELWLGGNGVAAGYLGRANLTAERFGADPLVRATDARRYRTGDRVRRLASGELEFLGRADGQVKLRGFRLELGEVEAALVAGRGIAQAAATVLGDGDGAQLVALYVPSAAPLDPAAEAAVLAALATVLPAYMVPQRLLAVARLLLNRNGKLDRGGLTSVAAAMVAPVAAAQGTAPRTEVERSVAAIWAEVLKREVADVNGNFFALGGHSLSAIRVLGKISGTFGLRLPLRALFDHPTVAQLATEIERARQPAAADVDAMLRELEAMSDAEAARLADHRPAEDSA